MSSLAKLDAGSRRRKDWVLIRSYVFSKDTPTKVDINKHSLDYVGKRGNKKYLTGVYGTNSGDAGGYLATNWANDQNLRIFYLDVWCEIPNFHASRAQMTRETIAESHWLHLDRMSVDLKEEVKTNFLEWIKKKHGAEAEQNAEDLSCQQLVLLYPFLANKLLDSEPEIGMLVHPIYTPYDEGSVKPLSLWAATINTELIQIKGAEIRYLPDVECFAE